MRKKILLILLIFTLHSLFAQDRVSFSNEFKEKNQGKYNIEINEVKELIQIMISVTPLGLDNEDMVQQQGEYYKDVITYFKPYKDEKIIKTFDSLMVSSIYNYIFLTGNAISYDFKGNKLIKSEIFDFPATSVANITIIKNPITLYKKQIEDFAKKSKFRKFYKKHKEYYSEIISEYEKNANLGNQWRWLEKSFETKINSYIVFCSPLINGLNYTGEFNNNDFRLIHMNLPPVDKYPKLTEIQNEIFNTRVMFTEIDHNYVNPPSDLNKEAIDRLFKDRDVWVDEKVYGVSAYPTPIKVFNEYMTYGVFLLYCKSHYDDENCKKVTQEVIDLMKERGFPKMKEFSENLFKISSKNQDKKIDQWYPEFLEQFTK